MRRRSLITFVVVNVLISIGVALLVIRSYPQQNQGASPMVITVPVVVSATPNPDVTQEVIVVTATPLPGTPQRVVLPGDVVETVLDATALPTFDVQVLEGNVALQGTATALPQNCVLHTIKEGDTPFGIALEYEVDGFLLMEVNDLTEEEASSLQIGDTLIVPLEGCPLIDQVSQDDETEAGTDDASALLASDETEESDGSPTLQPTARPTVTIAPTAENARVLILDVTDAGDITAEGVELENTGETVNIAGWTLSDTDGNVFTFPEQLLFSNARVTVYTREGTKTTIAFFWGLDEAVWQPGDVATLADSEGTVQSTYRIP